MKNADIGREKEGERGGERSVSSIFAACCDAFRSGAGETSTLRFRLRVKIAGKLRIVPARARARPRILRGKDIFFKATSSLSIMRLKPVMESY